MSKSQLMIRIVEANAGCYFTIDFGRLVPGLGLPADASTIDGEVALMERMISGGVHIVSKGLRWIAIPDVRTRCLWTRIPSLIASASYSQRTSTRSR
jgi:hypothetical protein